MRSQQAHQLGTARPRSTSTMTRRPSTLRPSAILYAVFMSFLCSYSMKAYPRGLPADAGRPRDTSSQHATSPSMCAHSALTTLDLKLSALKAAVYLASD